MITDKKQIKGTLMDNVKHNNEALGETDSMSLVLNRIKQVDFIGRQNVIELTSIRMATNFNIPQK